MPPSLLLNLWHLFSFRNSHVSSSTRQSWLFSQTMLSRLFLQHVKTHGSLFRPCRMSFQLSRIRTTGLFSCRHQHQNASPPPRFAEYLPPLKPQWKDISKAVRYATNFATGIATIMAVLIGASLWHRTEQDPITERKRLKLLSDDYLLSLNNDIRNLRLHQLGIANISLVLQSPSILSDDDPSTVIVNGVMEKMLSSNRLQNIGDLKIHVVDMISK